MKMKNKNLKRKKGNCVLSSFLFSNKRSQTSLLFNALIGLMLIFALFFVLNRINNSLVDAKADSFKEQSSLEFINSYVLLLSSIDHSTYTDFSDFVEIMSKDSKTSFKRLPKTYSEYDGVIYGEKFNGLSEEFFKVAIFKQVNLICPLSFGNIYSKSLITSLYKPDSCFEFVAVDRKEDKRDMAISFRNTYDYNLEDFPKDCEEANKPLGINDDGNFGGEK